MASSKHNSKLRKSPTTTTQAALKVTIEQQLEDQPPTDLHLTSRGSLTEMTPGDIVLLDEISYLRESFAPKFIAILACPRCGTPGLVTSTQLSGAGPIVCVSQLCSGQFRIINETQIISMSPS